MIDYLKQWSLKIVLISSVLALGFNIPSYSQSSMNTGGGDISGSNGSISLSIGQVVYKPHQDLSTRLTEGVQQPFISNISTGHNFLELHHTVKLYPNPTQDALHIEVLSNLAQFISYEISDLGGKKHLAGIILNQKTISIETLPPAIYFITFYLEEKRLDSYTVIKY